MSPWHSLPISLTEDLDEHEIHLDICWQRVSNYICNQPLRGRRTTYTECCCRYGEAWSQDCALCPHRASGENRGTRTGLLRDCGAFGLLAPASQTLQRSAVSERSLWAVDEWREGSPSRSQ